ncbi:MAG: Sugar-specific transcriptional regulator TrmB [Methanomassiliicoccales archaeon PtaU1.Bin124]|nr:MAG: Sugar-specific transcriptional regulator TrmB [Methanomassiliicoccales archaeon PtaU1.Bin124]
MNIIDVLRLDLKDLGEEYDKVASVLMKLGLSEYEARLFVAAVIRSFGTADELAELSMVPRTSAYKALQALEEKDFVTSSSGRPTIYHPVDLNEIRSRVQNELNDVFDKLASVKGLLSEKGTPELVYTIVGKKRIMSKIGEMVEAAKRRILISSPLMKEIRLEHNQRFKEAMKRGVEVIIISESMVKLPDATRIIRKKNLMATDVIIDSSMAIMASPELDLCGYSDNPFLASHLENFIMDSLEKADVV